MGTNTHLARATKLAPSLIGRAEFFAAFTAQRFAQARRTLPGRAEEGSLGDDDDRQTNADAADNGDIIPEKPQIQG
ncbi:MAG: hypothetical protein WAW02_14025 [Sideroxyarcus sp.]